MKSHLTRGPRRSMLLTRRCLAHHTEHRVCRESRQPWPRPLGSHCDRGPDLQSANVLERRAARAVANKKEKLLLCSHVASDAFRSFCARCSPETSDTKDHLFLGTKIDAHS